jgi:hypothetical protein
MPERFKEPTSSDAIPSRPRSSWGLRLVIGLSIPMYLAQVWVIMTWLPLYSFFALLPAVFALHSAVILLPRRKG